MPPVTFYEIQPDLTMWLPAIRNYKATVTIEGIRTKTVAHCRCDIYLTWMCCDCSLVNEEQQIYVDKSENVHGLIWSCQKCIFNKLDVITELKQK